MYGRIKKIHFVGIGGSGMSGIAEVLINLGYEVSGSDINCTAVTSRLEDMGAKITYGHDAGLVHGADVVVVSSAIKEDNPEVTEARSLNIPVIKRAEMLAELMRLKYGIAVSGSHGKTTTTSMIEEVLTAGGYDPTAIVGGKLISSGTGAKLGEGPFLIAEADESDGSFHKLNPVIVVVTNIDDEHLDFYGSYEAVKEAFVEFANRIPFYGLAVMCIDDPGVMSILPRLEKRVLTYGISAQADLRAENIVKTEEGYSFNVIFQNEALGEVSLGMKGEHNVLNALASIAVGIELEMPFERVAKALSGFQGVHRRFEIVGEKDGVVVVDDYGHHPTEILTTLETARAEFPGRRLVVVFQPHRYSRTKLLKHRFPPSLRLADVLILTDVYPAGEVPREGGRGEDLYQELRNQGLRNVVFAPSLEEAWKALCSTVREGDVLLTLGAGNVYTIAERFLSD